MDPRTRLIRPLPGSISIESEGDRRILCARGELDSAVVQDFKDRQGREPVVVDAIDAGAVTFISSTGIAIMLRCLEASKAAGVQWYIVEQDRCQRDPFESLGISLRNLQAMGLQ